MLSSVVGLLRLVSLVICVVVIASFAIFVDDQARGASAHQVEAIKGAPAQGAAGSTGTSSTHESTLHKTIDEASDDFTSPFSGVTSGSKSQWVIRGVNLLITLAVYGFGVGFLARVLRVRV